MTASLNHSGSSSTATGAGTIASSGTVRFGVSSAMRRLWLQNVRLPDVGIEPDIIPAAMPRVRGVVEQIVDGEHVGIDRRFDESVLCVMRIGIDDREQAEASLRRSLAVGDDLRVVGCVETQCVIELERRLCMPDAVDPADELRD